MTPNAAPGMGDWIAAVGGQGASTGAASRPAVPALPSQFLIGLFALAALWIWKH